MIDENPIFFKSRFAPEYFEHMTERLRLASDEVVAVQGRDDCKGQIRIASMGVSCSTFFKPVIGYGDKAHRASQAFLDEFDKLMNAIVELNRRKISLSLRFILAYPFSDYAMRLMMREKEQQKPVWDIFDRDDVEFGELDFGTTNGEHQEMFVQFQSKTLQQFDYLRERIRRSQVSLTYNQIELRFTPVPLNYRGVFLNRCIYYDIYTYSKLENMWPAVASQLPVICVQNLEQEAKREGYFKTLSQDFEYIWYHAATLLYGDAVDKGKIRPPENVDHRDKFRLIDSRTSSPGLRASVKHLSKHFFRNSVRIHDGLSQDAQVFIACSWEVSSIGWKKPNQVAQDIHDFISRVFSKSASTDEGLSEVSFTVQPKYVMAEVGERIPDAIYQALNEATYAIVLLTKDIVTRRFIENKRKTIYYTRSSVVHELGYLNHRIRRISKGDLLTLVEEGVEPPSNESAFVMYPFVRETVDGRLSLLDTVMAWMARSLCAFDQMAYVRACQILYEKQLISSWPNERFPLELEIYLKLRGFI
ncbi:hypothetical protein [Tistrella mobilis]|uniref:Uncharacterized protein n=1 Tax=Tistrella mobilis (strain KA081020-065) TaxID=1110502 RepID=I3TWE0_TISMK|nr:hypothetical protein [Tistrella mobilis]AFK57078.1 hypothetical protein TMO_c0468 [Tistrella mobilis KA081020-065]